MRSNGDSYACIETIQMKYFVTIYGLKCVLVEEGWRGQVRLREVVRRMDQLESQPFNWIYGNIFFMIHQSMDCKF